MFSLFYFDVNGSAESQYFRPVFFVFLMRELPYGVPFFPNTTIIHIKVPTKHSRIRSHIFYWSMSVVPPFYVPHFIGKQFFYDASQHTRVRISNDNKTRIFHIRNVEATQTTTETCSSEMLLFSNVFFDP